MMLVKTLVKIQHFTISQMEAVVFLLLPANTTRHNLTKEEWLARREFAENHVVMCR